MKQSARNDIVIDILWRQFPSIVGLLISLAFSYLLMQILGPALATLEMEPRIRWQLVIRWGVTFIVLLIILIWERKPLTSIGLRMMTRRDALWGFIGFLLSGLIIMVTMPLVSAFGLSTIQEGVQQLAEVSMGLRVAIVLTAGITEEILYRGYPIERLNTFTGHLGLSGAISYVIFVGLHYSFWGLGGTIQIGLGSVLIYALYLWRRNLPACMLMHLLNDAVAFLVIPVFLP